MKDIRSLLLALLSVGLIATWFYHFYDKTHSDPDKKQPDPNESVTRTNAVRDSLDKMYSATLAMLDSKLDSTTALSTSQISVSDSLQSELDKKINEVNRLRTEINNILRNPSSSIPELIQARKKIAELESLVKDLRDDKTNLENEKLQMITRLDQIDSEFSGLQKAVRRLEDENKNLNSRIKSASGFTISALHFTAMDVRETKEQETSAARRANKFVMSFVLQNNFTEYMNAEIILVVIGPDGQVLQNSAWDSGTFDTKAEGKKSFTRKIKFDYIKGEQKALVFSLGVDSIRKGTYTLQVWHDGSRIGEIKKTMN